MEGGDHWQHFTLYDIDLTPNEVECLLVQRGVALAALGGRRRRDVINEGREAQVLMLQRP